MFFPAGDRTAQLLNAAAVFAVGFLMRPIGAWIMGIYSDRRGRKAGLTLSVSPGGVHSADTPTKSMQTAIELHRTLNPFNPDSLSAAVAAAERGSQRFLDEM